MPTIVSIAQPNTVNDKYIDVVDVADVFELHLVVTWISSYAFLRNLCPVYTTHIANFNCFWMQYGFIT